MFTRPPRTKLALVALVAVALLAAACSSGAASTTSSTSTTSGGSVTTSSIPAGTVLRIGDQLKALETVLSISGEDKNFRYQVQYSQFVGGPPMLQAFEGGSIDAGFVQSTPLIFAQAAGQTINAVAGWAPRGSSYALVSAPGNTSIKGWAGLKGKRVAYQQGTALEAVLLQGLESAGLTLKDITTVNLPSTQISAALQGGSADAGISIEPLLSAYLAANPTARVITRPDSITDRAQFLIASSTALQSPGTSAALADYISRLVKAYKYTAAHPQAAIQAIYIDQYQLTPARAAAVSALTGPTSFFPLPGQVLAPQQQLADLYVTAGVIPNKVDVAKQFDSRFNALVTMVQGS